MSISKRMRVLLIIVAAECAVLIGVVGWAWSTKTPDSAKQPAQVITATEPPSIAPKMMTGGLDMPLTITSTGNREDKRLFVVEQSGKIRIINADGTLVTKPLLDLSGTVLIGSEMGLLGLTFHPDFATNHFLYVNYVDKNRQTIIARFTANKETTSADPASQKILLTLKQPYDNHNGGDLHFGPDGYLYIALGDGGSGGDPENRAQNTKVLFGKILRIDVDNKQPYDIPDNNPYRIIPGAAPEIWALGLRNPWRFSFDRKTGEMYIADVGQSAVEELNVQSADSKGGENYGWRCYEGPTIYNTDGCQAASSYVKPVLAYDHSSGRCSITGGFVYRGSRYPNMSGKYFYADFCSGQIYYTEPKQEGTWGAILAAKHPARISSFGEDNNGELYFSDYENGAIYRIEDSLKK